MDQNTAITEKTLHPNKVHVWCALWAGGIISPFVFINEDGKNVTVNGERYRDMVINFFEPQLAGINLADRWFQQDGATYHTARDTIFLHKDTFGERIISVLLIGHQDRLI